MLAACDVTNTRLEHSPFPTSGSSRATVGLEIVLQNANLKQNTKPEKRRKNEGKGRDEESEGGGGKRQTI